MKTLRVLLVAVLVLSVTALLAFAWKNQSTKTSAQTTTQKESDNQKLVDLAAEESTVPAKEESATPIKEEPVATEEESLSDEPYNWEEEERKREAKALSQFPSFLAHFPKANFPITITKEDFKKYQFFKDANVAKDQNIISNDFASILPEMERHRFSRESYESEYHYIARLKKGKDLTVVLVAGSDDRFGKGDYYGNIPNVYINMLTFDKNGKRIATETIAYIHPFTNGYQTVIINKDLSIEAKEFTFIREKDTEKEGFENNPVKGEKFERNITYTVNEAGEIKNTDNTTAKM
jgi:hypothetical protein